MEICKTTVQRFEEVWTETVVSWIKKVESICEDLPWPLDWFCKVVTTLIKVVEVIVRTVIRVIITVVCYTVTAVLFLVANVINLILAIPVLGTALKTYLGGLAWVWSQFVGATDAALGFLGIRPIKNLRLHIVILMRPDRTLTVPPDRIALAIQRTESIFRARADVKITTTVHQVDTPSVRNALHVDSNLGFFAEDMGDAGMYFQTTIIDMLYEHSVLFAFRIGAPVVAFVVDGVGTDAIGVSPGPALDYVCIEGGQMMTPPWGSPVGSGSPVPNVTMNDASTTLAHELGHACGLAHDSTLDEVSGDPTNLMCASGLGVGDNLSPFQRAIVRSSPHVTYL